MFDIDSLAVFLKRLYLIVSDDDRRKRTCCLFLSLNISRMSELMMIIMTGLIIAIKDNGFLAVSSSAAPIRVLHIRICRRVPLVRSLRTHFIDR